MGFGSRYYLGNKHHICIQIIIVVKKNLFVHRASSEGIDGFKLERVDPLKEGRRTVEDLAQSVYVDTALCSAMGLAALWRARRGLKLSLVSRGTHIPYSAAVDLVAGSGYLKFFFLSSKRCDLSGDPSISCPPIETPSIYVLVFFSLIAKIIFFAARDCRDLFIVFFSCYLIFGKNIGVVFV
ncbi:hypothetical protein M9H77_07975 [Catharanthus roseus]|uniref:Uncharacterized protein n=1 Tax=Catharanthus roseus TaxID=4058 RepID=A0ACC0BWM8_CATRO|nr:hypothetical protein M9H77_07975 [Catharanthus roseus]